MQGKLYITAPGTGPFEIRSIEAPPTLEELQALVDGYIERIPGLDKMVTGDGVVRCIAFGDEEGKLVGKRVNHYATARWNAALGFAHHDFLVGTIVIMTADDELWAKWDKEEADA